MDNKVSISFDEMPRVLSDILEKLANLERFMLSSPSNTIVDQWFSLNELCSYLPEKPARSTVYAWVGNGLIPYHKTGKCLRFLKSEIDNWLATGKPEPDIDYVSRQAQDYLDKHPFLR